MAIKDLNDTAHDSHLREQREVARSNLAAQQEQVQERKQREAAHKQAEIERDRTDLAYVEASKLCESAAQFNKTQSK